MENDCLREEIAHVRAENKRQSVDNWLNWDSCYNLRSKVKRERLVRKAFLLSRHFALMKALRENSFET